MILGGNPMVYVPHGRNILPNHPQDHGFPPSDNQDFQQDEEVILDIGKSDDQGKGCLGHLLGEEITRGVGSILLDDSDINMDSNLNLIKTDSKSNMSKLFYPGHQTNTFPKKEDWRIRPMTRQDGVEDSIMGEEELYWSDRTVMLSITDGVSTDGRHLVKSFTSIDKVSTVAFVKKGICVLEQSCRLSLYCDNGDHFPVFLPFPLASLLSTPSCLLLERSDVLANSLPVLFTLTHCLKDIKPILYRMSKKTSCNFVTPDMHIRIVDVITFKEEEESWVVMYSEKEHSVSVWKLRSADKDEIPQSQTPVPTKGTPLSAQSNGMGGVRTSRSLSILKEDAGRSSMGHPLNRIPISPLNNISPSLMSMHKSLGRLPLAMSSPLVRSPSFHLGTNGHSLTETPDNKLLYGSSKKGSSFSRLMMDLNKSTPRHIDFEYREKIDGPVLPDYTLEHMWSEPCNSSVKPSKAFVTKDLMQQPYLVYLVPSTNQMKLVKYDRANTGGKVIFGSTSVVPAKDVEPLPALNMILILDLSNNLVLYSGTSLVGVIYLPVMDMNQTNTTIRGGFLSPREASDRRKSFASFLYSPLGNDEDLDLSTIRGRDSLGSFCQSSSTPLVSKYIPNNTRFNPAVDETSKGGNESNISSIRINTSLEDTTVTPLQMRDVTSLQDGVQNRVTVCDSSGKMLRFPLPPMSCSTVVDMCLKSLKSVLPKDISMQLMIKWYKVRNANDSNNFTDPKELSRFKRCLLSLIGYEVEDLEVSYCGTESMEVTKKPRIDGKEEEGTDEDFLWFQNQMQSRENGEDSLSPDNILTPTPSSILFPFLPNLMFALHLTYEELKLNTLLWDFAPQLLDILFLFATDLKHTLYQDHYWRDFPNVCARMSTDSRIPDSDSKSLSFPSYFTESPPSIHSFLTSILTNNNYTQLIPFPNIPSSCTRTRNIILLFACIRNGSCAERTLIHNIEIQSRRNKEPELVLPSSPDAPSKERTAERMVLSMDLMGLKQQDLETMPPAISLPLWQSIFRCRQDPPADWSSSCYSLIGRTDLYSLKENMIFSKRIASNMESDVDSDGLMCLNKETLKLLFPEDQRVNEAYHMLQSSEPVKISIAQKEGVSDHDFIEEQERHLYNICNRTMALPLGRGMFTLRTYKPVVAEMFPIPKLCLTGKVPPKNCSVEMNHIDTPANMNVWPSFHNGVAAGLRATISANDAIDSSWIIYNKPKSTISGDAPNEHAGFLLAMGLNGHLSKLSPMNIHDYLMKGHELTRVGVLLGLAAEKKGSMDQDIMKALSIHVEAFLIPTSSELDLTPVVQVASVLAIGLLYQESGNHHVAANLLGEIGRPPGPEMEHYIDRESYALAAGLAFGLVTLGKGNEMTSSVSSSVDGIPITEQLCSYMFGGTKRPLTTVQKEKYKTPSYQIREGDNVNADVTSPGATLGLGLFFFNTNNEAVATWVTAPDSQHLLEMVRPDFLMLRTLSKALIMWSTISPTKEWAESHLPPIVKQHAFLVKGQDERIDYETMSQAWCNIMAGACMAVGLKFAGSADPMAFKLVMGYCKYFFFVFDRATTDRGLELEMAGRSTIESALNVVVLSLGLIMAGTGNLEVMKVVRYLRSRTSNKNVVLYGSHMASHMALGLLFLGGCRYTISTSPTSIAALICAFFPKFPIHSNDNRYHLQAFRHLYVLAVEPRLVIPRDIDTGHFSVVSLRIRYRNRSQCTNEWVTMRAPCIIPELCLIDKLVLLDDRYWKISFERGKNWNTLTSFLAESGVMNVKKKVGCLPYSEDPKGYKSLNARFAMTDAVKGWSYQSSSLSAFSNEMVVSNFCSLVLTPRSGNGPESQLQHAFTAFLVDCSLNETMECLTPLIMLENMKKMGKPSSLHLWQLKLAVTSSCYLECLKGEFVEGLRSFLDSKVKEAASKEIVKYLRGEVNLCDVSSSTAEALLVSEMPPYGSLSPLHEKPWSFPDLVSNLRHFSLPMSTLTFLGDILNSGDSEN